MPSDQAAVGPLRGGLALHLGAPLAGTAAALVSVPAAPSQRRSRGRAQPPAPVEPADPAALLARLMDLHGSVGLARELGAAAQAQAPMLQAPARPRDRSPAAATAAVRALVEGRLAELVAALRRTFEDPFPPHSGAPPGKPAAPPSPHRRNKLPGPAELRALLEQAGALGPGGRRLTPAIAAVWEPFGELANRGLGKIRYELRSLRAEIAPALRSLGPDAARLERLDASISAAIEEGRERILDALAPALAQGFGRSLEEALAKLPEGAGLADLRAWYAPDGWLRAEIERIRRVVEAVLAHRARRLLALVEAVLDEGAGRG